MKLLLVALDGSKRAPHVLETAVSLARAFSAKLVLLRVVRTPPEISDELRTNWVSLEQAMYQDATADMARIVATLSPDMVAGSAVELATPWDGICRKAKTVGADCIVIGSHGYSMLDRILGTNAAKVVNHADCSVLVVRPDRTTTNS